MKIRRDLGKFGDWHGPASAEAIMLARAIEITWTVSLVISLEAPRGL
jgi:hypothetical protein